MTLASMLRRTAASPRAAVHYLNEDGSRQAEPAGELMVTASRVLSGLRAAGIRPGEPVMVVSARNREFLAAFWGCVLGGMLPAPLAAAGGIRSAPIEEKIARVAARLGRPWVLVDDQASVRGAVDCARILRVADLLRQHPADSFHEAAPTEPAFLQFSSGSTGEPKGVILTHANLIANMEAMTRGVELGENDSLVSWMPLHHDMGLIGFHLAALYRQVPHTLMEARLMARRPLLWLDALERYRATITGCPPSALALVLRALEREPERPRDLSCVRLIINGAEPIPVDLMQRFMARMAPFGLRPAAMFPVYGLAEATLAVAFPPLGAPPEVESLDRRELQENGRAVAAEGAGAIRFAVEGAPVAGVSVRIVDAADRPLPDGCVGHIQVRGPNVTSGYWRDESATREVFCGDWLRTGDLGFLRNGRLCVTGRAKDLIFVNGQNLYAHDIEAVAAKVEGVDASRVAACAWRAPGEDRERLALFAACAADEAGAAIFADIKRRIRRTFGIEPDTLVPLRPAGFPRTTSGKLQRYLLRQRLERGEFDAESARMAALVAAEKARRAVKVMPSTATECALHRLWCERMGLAPDSVGVRDDFEDLGGTSLDAASLIAEIERHFRVRLHSEVLAANPTIERLAAYIDRHGAALESSRRPRFAG